MARFRSLTMVLLTVVTLLTVPLATEAAAARASLNIPRQVNGHRTNVGLLILGHSTSDQGDYPQKLAQALNADPADGRNYQVFELITGGDGGFGWSQAKFAPTDLQFNRVAASNEQQWCTDAQGNRWSARRVRVDRALSGSADPTGGACANTAPANIGCTYYDTSGAHPASGFRTCWQRMDVTLALIQDTTNRSWPVDDFSGDGQVTAADLWPASRINDAAEPCTNGRSGVVNGNIDWTCDGVTNGADAAHVVYAGWLERFSPWRCSTITAPTVSITSSSPRNRWNSAPPAPITRSPSRPTAACTTREPQRLQGLSTISTILWCTGNGAASSS